MTTVSGALIELSAAGSTDPDGDALTYSWFFYEEAGSYTGPVTIQNSSSPEGILEIPNDAHGKTIHVILEITDTGSPNLTAYRRIIFTVNDPTE